MNCNEYVDIILSKLTGNTKEDKEYLKEEMLKLSRFKEGASIFNDVKNKITASHGDNVKTALNEALKEYIDKINTNMHEVKPLMEQKNFSEAKLAINNIIEMSSVLLFEDDSEKRFYFKNINEFLYATKKLNANNDKKLVWGAPAISMLYNWLSYIEIENKNFSEAEKCCDLAITYDPMDPYLYFEKAELFIKEGRLQDALEVLNEAYDKIFDCFSMATYYRKLGYINVDIYKPKAAFACYLTSLHFNFSNVARSELEYIRKKVNIPNYNLTTEEVMNTLREENIPFGPKMENINIMNDIANNSNFENNFSNVIENIKKELNFFSREMTPVRFLFK